MSNSFRANAYKQNGIFYITIECFQPCAFVVVFFVTKFQVIFNSCHEKRELNGACFLKDLSYSPITNTNKSITFVFLNLISPCLDLIMYQMKKCQPLTVINCMYFFRNNQGLCSYEIHSPFSGLNDGKFVPYFFISCVLYLSFWGFEYQSKR